MKKATIIILAAALVFTAVSCKSSVTTEVDPEGISSKGSYENYEYSLKADGSTLDFTIEGNPTTGYQWQFLTKDDSIELVSGDYVQNDNPGMMVGVGGKYVFVIDFKADGDYSLDFAYMRSWAPEDGLIKLALDVSVKNGVITGAAVEE